jgi:hypothetical protein
VELGRLGLGSIHARPQDLMAGFNVASLFTRVLISKAMSLLGQQIEDILRLFDKS